jgi:transcriptional regulator with XRE-family HTH domain
LKAEEPDLSIGRQLRELRLSRDVSQSLLADTSGIDQAVISRVEKGADARWSTIRRLFLALGFMPALNLEPYCEDDADDFLRNETQQRKDRLEAGRMARW